MKLALNHAGRLIGGEESTCTAIRTKGAMLTLDTINILDSASA